MSIDNIDIAKLKDICRTCLQESNAMESVYKTKIADMLMECTSIKVNVRDGLSGLICIDCVTLVNKFYSFKTRCLENENFLRELQPINAEISNDIVNNSLISREHLLSDTKLQQDLSSDSDGNDNEKYHDHDETDVNNRPKKQLTNSNSRKKIKKQYLNKSFEAFQCQVCDKILGSAFSLLRHTEIHNRARKFSHKCSICKKGFYEKGNFIKHMRRHTEEKSFSCPECPKKYYEISALVKHVKRHQYIKPQIKCTCCDEIFLLQVQLDAHMKMHLVHQCNECGKLFNQQYLLKRHERSHSKEQPYQCTKCDKAFKHPSTLELHMKKHNGIQRKDICKICGQTFANLKMHLMKHTTVRPHKCPECGKGLRTTVHLREHMRKHTGEKRVPNVLCMICGKKVLDSCKLRIHMRIHTGERPFVCNVCNKGFIMRHALTVHMRGHTNEKPFICDVCGKGFKEGSTLKVHYRIHTGERPFSCKVCDKTFTQSGALRTHMKVHPATENH